jgi:hypothetical protein
VKHRSSSRWPRLLPWPLLGTLAALLAATYASQPPGDSSSAYVAVHAQTARPLSARLSLEPGAGAAPPGRGVELVLPVPVPVGLAAAGVNAAAPRRSALRHEYPRGPPTRADRRA